MFQERLFHTTGKSQATTRRKIKHSMDAERFLDGNLYAAVYYQQHPEQFPEGSFGAIYAQRILATLPDVTVTRHAEAA
ncbi:MAG: hypothetical protein LAP61_24955 [Acidobacteriia bacterium]|nr:hypothetical protein [Terriglobia bacterium]